MDYNIYKNYGADEKPNDDISDEALGENGLADISKTDTRSLDFYGIFILLLMVILIRKIF